jgi:hypothetical protein
MSQLTSIAVCGDPDYAERVVQDFLIGLGWSRRRRKKWLRRNGLRLARQPDWLENAVDGDVLEGPCWCGEEDPYYAPLEGTCAGTGVMNCYCGGDQCVCHNHGEVECFGCADCDRADGRDEFDDDEDW